MINVRLAARTLSRTPFVTAVAVISLALGIGANAAIFSLFDELLLQSLPVRAPDELVNFTSPGPKPGSQSCNQAGNCDEVFSYPMFRDLERQQTAFTGIAAHRLFGANIALKGQTALSDEGLLVSGSYFPVLGLTPTLGRLLTPDDDRNVGGHFVAVLGHSFWQSRLGSSPDVLNQAIVINGQTFTIVGVAPAGFEGTTLGGRPSIYVPMTMYGLMLPGWNGFENRRSYSLYLFARRKPGISIEAARTSINGAYKPIINTVEAPLQQGMSDQTMVRFKAREIGLNPGMRGQSSVHKEAKTPLSLLFGITGIVLLIACANIANLLLARAAGRSTEMAMRLSLGAGRKQLLAQLLTESVLLAVLGGVVSLLVARWTLIGITQLLPSEAAVIISANLRLPVIVFASLLSIGTGLMFGMFPAIHSTRPDLISTIRANTGQPSGARAASRFRTSLVTVQIALSMALLTSAGLFIKSLVNVSKVDLGIQVDNVITFGISPLLNGYSNTRSRALFDRVEEELKGVPGVTAVASAMVAVMAGNNYNNDVSVQGFKKTPDTDANSSFNEISAGYFRSMGIPLMAGREFELADGLGAPKVAVVNQAFAKKFNLGRDAIGKFMSTGDDKLDVQIVGLVQDAKYSEVKDVVPPQFFLPARQDSSLGYTIFYVRTSRDPSLLLKTVPGVISRLDPNLPVEELKTLPQQVKENVFLDRMISTLAAAFAALATLLAAVGLYGVLAYTVAQRTREIGVRMALGAHGGQVRGLVVRQVARMTLIGGAVGVAGAIGIGRAAQSLLFGLKGSDPLVLAISTVLLALVAFGAGYIPALRASRVHPMQALRYE